MTGLRLLGAPMMVMPTQAEKNRLVCTSLSFVFVPLCERPGLIAFQARCLEIKGGNGTKANYTCESVPRDYSGAIAYGL